MAEAAVPVRKAQLAAQAKEQRKMMRRQRSAADGAGQRKRPLRPAEAAARLQAHWRSVVARRRWRVLRRAARIIQRNWRRYLDAKRRERQRGFHLELRKMREKQTAKQELLSRHQKELAEIDQLPGRAVPAWERLNRTLAVVKFQARWRGIVARRRCEALRLRKRQAEAAALIQRAFRAHRLYINRPKFADLVARFARVNLDEARVAELQRQVLDGRRPWLEKHRIDRLRCAPRPSLAETYRRAQELVDQRWRDRVRFNVASEQRTRLREDVASLYRQLTEGAAVDDALPPMAEAASMPWDPLDGIDEASRSAHRKALEQASKPWWKTLEPVQPI